MKISFQDPPADLRSLVVTFWRLEATASALTSDPRRVLPDGCPEVVVHLGAPFRRQQDGVVDTDPRAFVFGQLRQFIDLTPTGAVRAVGARLHPSALAPLTQTSAHRFTGGPVGLEHLWGAEGPKWREELLRCQDADSALAALTEGLRRQWRGKTVVSGHPLVDSGVAAIRRTGGRVRISHLSRWLGCSPRHLERLFRQQVGLSPKEFTRIARFCALQRHLASGVRERWSELAFDFGFADQAHMIREFRAYSGLAPGIFEASGQLQSSSLWLI